MDRHFKRLQRTWDQLGDSDPLWAILSHPEKRAVGWDIADFFATGQQEIDEVLRSVTAQFPNVPRTCALDFGCGVGRLTRPLAVHFNRVMGVDVAPSMIHRAQELNSDVQNCEFVLNMRADLSIFESGSVDFIYSNIVLQHMARVYAENYIREFVRLLSPQGLAVFQVPSRPDRHLDRLLPNVIPGLLLELYRRVRYGKLRAEMHAIPTERVHAIVRAAGGQIGEESSFADSGWISNWYYVRRSRDVA